MNLCLQINPEIDQAIREAAAERMMTKATWVRQAIFAYLRTAESNRKKYNKQAANYPSGYPKGAKCFHCKAECHDPAEVHGYLPEEIGDVELAYAKSHPC